MEIKLGLRWFYKTDTVNEIPHELFDLLQAIHVNGSLRAAAEECDSSYRHAWGLLQSWQQCFSQPLAELKRGRGKGAVLTPFAEKLLGEYKHITAQLEPELDSQAVQLSSKLTRLVSGVQIDSLKIGASHGLAIASLKKLAKQSSGMDLDIQFHGSLDALMQYKNGFYDIAGFHIAEGVVGLVVLSQIKRYINIETDILVHAVRRHQGLMTFSGNPKKIENLTDLLRPEIKFINRQKSSGTRLTFDQWLIQAGIEKNRINGYENEEFTHNAVAALVASGNVDCGFGIEAAAAQFNLHFIPLNWESYWFVMPKKKLLKSSVNNFVKLLHSVEFYESTKKFSGYDTSRSGIVVEPDHELSVLLL